MLIISWRTMQLLKRDFCDSVRVCHFFLLSATEAGFPHTFPFHSCCFLTLDNPHKNRHARWSPHVRWHPALMQSQRSTLNNSAVNSACSRMEKRAQPGWMAASVSLVSPEQLRGQVLINGTEDASHLRWRGSSPTWSMNHAQQVCDITAADLHTNIHTTYTEVLHSWPWTCASTTNVV